MKWKDETIFAQVFMYMAIKSKTGRLSTQSTNYHKSLLFFDIVKIQH